ncbi:hypothetical protein [Pseudomonas sp. NPDC089569]|uniref:hypothetical protein n=1 Tax=Pseudomonas sp. NPDC089569 TaxID=3390722 RepID=UPI003CFD01E6
MLAMVVNDYAGGLTLRGVLSSIASMLAPTEEKRSIDHVDSHHCARPFRENGRRDMNEVRQTVQVAQNLSSADQPDR